MIAEILSASAKALLPVARAVWPHARRLHAERQAGQSYAHVVSGQINKILDKTYVHLKGGVEDEQDQGKLGSELKGDHSSKGLER